MEKYVVSATTLQDVTIIVEANSIEEAEDIAADIDIKSWDKAGSGYGLMDIEAEGLL